MILVENMSKVYNMGQIKVEALHEVNLTVKAGEFVAIIGPSGSGKSTLMHLLGCLDIPTSGRYVLDGEEAGKMSENRLAAVRNRKIGFVFQSFNLLPRLTALENVELPLIYRGLRTRERRKRAIASLEQVDLANRMKHRPRELSGGQQQRVAIARALASDPALIMADEPTGNLDSVSGQEVMKTLVDLNSAGRTILLITHDQQVATQAKRVIRILDGRLVKGENLSPGGEKP